jgi:5'-nucleotidase
VSCRSFVAALVLLLASITASAQPAPRPRPATVDVQLLAFYDFHGSLEPRSGSSGRIGDVEVGGAEYLASQLARLEATNPNTIIVSAGDNIGASPLLSSMFHDEPTIEALNAAGLQLSAVGNHELDDGWPELYRIQKGGCHPVDGCQDRTPYLGARFQYLAANVLVRGRRVLPASVVKTIGGVRVGFIGLTLRGVPQLVSPAALEGVTFAPEAAAANAAARRLRQLGVRTIVVLIHEGGTPKGTDVNGCDGFAGPIVAIAKAMTDDVDVIVSGHTHEAYICTIGRKLVTSAKNYGRLITDIDLTIDRRTGRVVAKSARNVLVAHDVPKSAAETAIIEHYRPFAATLGSKVVGAIAGPITREPTPAGECALGDVIADAMLEGSRDASRGGAVAAVMNPGGIRTELVGLAGDNGGPRTVTYEQVFDVQPFGNQVVVRTMTGDALVRLLEQQFENRTSECGSLLQVAGIRYAYDPDRPNGQRIDRASLMIDGRPLVATNRYRVASNDFLWAGGDGFTVATEGFDPVGAGPDVDLFVDYLRRHTPLPVPPRDRITRSR